MTSTLRLVSFAPTAQTGQTRYEFGPIDATRYQRHGSTTTGCGRIS